MGKGVVVPIHVDLWGLKRECSINEIIVDIHV